MKAYKAKVKTMSNLDLLSKISSIKGTPSDRWEFDCAVTEMEKRLEEVTVPVISLKAKANEGWENGKQITILQIEGDPLNLETSRAFDLNIDIQIPLTSIQKSQEPMGTSAKDIAKKKWELSNGSHTQLDCSLYDIRMTTCEGPECRKFAGTDYAKCPYASKKGVKYGRTTN